MSYNSRQPPPLSLPPWTNPEFRERCEREGFDAVVPSFSWYQPQFLKKARPIVWRSDSAAQDPSPSASIEACCFPPLREVVGLDYSGPPSAAMGSVKEAALPPEPAKKKGRKDKADVAGEEGDADVNEAVDDPETLAIFGRVGQPTAIEDLWFGPPLSAKVPPAADYERLLNGEE